MNIIEEKIKKFNKAKRKLQNQQLTELTKTFNNSILSILRNQKTINENKINSSLNLTKEKKEINKKEKTKFLTKKFDEQNTLKDNNQKEISPNLKNDKLYQNKNLPNINNQNSIKQNITENNRSNGSDTYGSTINLLNMENGDIKPQEVQKIFKKERNIEEKKKKKENEKILEISEKNYELKKKDLSVEMDDFDDFDDEEIEKDKNKSYNKNKNELFNNLFMYKKESGINLNENFNIFDETKMMKDNDNSFAIFGDMDNNDYGNDYLFNNSFTKKRNKIENKSNNFTEKNENLNENENNINNKYNTPVKEKENKNNENDFMNLSNNSNCNSLKICIPLDKLDLNLPQENNIYINLKKDILKKDGEHNEKKYLGKKTKYIESSIKKNSYSSKSEPNIINIEHKNNIIKNNKKVIVDDEDEEEEPKLTEKNKLTNSLFKSPLSKNEIKNEIKNDSLGVLLTNYGTKFTLKIEESDTKSKNNKSVSDFIPKSLKNENLNNSLNKNLNLNPSKNISINIDNSNKIKNNKNKINLINKNKNGSQKAQRKDINNNDNYESQCLNNINNILIKISERLSKEKIDKNFMKNCFEICDIIKNMINNPSKKKSIYLQFLLIMKNLFLNISENKVSKNYITEINQIFESIEQYFKKIKKDKVLCGSSSFTKRKFAFKYAFAKLELKNMDEIFLKGIIPKTNDENKNNESRSDSNSLIKFTKISKRYLKTSKFLLKELKEFREKMNNSQIKNKYKKYESCLADIQMSPHFMSYNRLFYHSYIILSFYNDYNKLNEEINDKNNNKISKDKINKEKNKSKSNQINHKLNGYGQNEKIIKEKKRDKSEDIKKIQLKK